MQVNLDDFFREQEQLLAPDLSHQEQHWQQLKTRFPVPAKKPGSGLLKKTAIAVSVAGSCVLLYLFLIQNKKEIPGKQVAATVPAKQNDSKTNQTEWKNTAGTEQKVSGNNPLQPVNRTGIKNETPKDKTVSVKEQRTIKKVSSGTLINNEAKFYIDLSKEPEVFPIDPVKENTITCKQGTQLIIPANILTDAGGNTVKEIVSVSIQEYYRYDSNQKQKGIANAGMIKYEFFKGTEKLRVTETGAVAIIMKPVVAGNRIKIIRSEDYIPESTMKTLSWVSREKFTSDKREKLDYQITLDPHFDANSFMSAIAFPDDKVIMAGDLYNNSIIFRNVPLGETAFFISVGKIENKYFHASKKLVTGKATISELDFVEISEALYKKQIDELGKLGQ
jgi:hypothetical protein